MPSKHEALFIAFSSYICVSRSGSQHDERLASELCRRKRAAWGAFSGYRASSEEDKEHPAPRSPFRHSCPSCLDECLGGLDFTEAGFICSQRHSKRFGKDNARNFSAHPSAKGNPVYRAPSGTKIRDVDAYAKKSMMR
ncbi:unnamed protein product [Haemonchus placei]|uniref:Secreted protein n=1 Tax=Haemonchus placei TaxID=6290 RepID=A0A0N4W4X5_HAEPC|nr:unnamed protein product [Haemonchus placei]